jgi:hypothetical protein
VAPPCRQTETRRCILRSRAAAVAGARAVVLIGACSLAAVAAITATSEAAFAGTKQAGERKYEGDLTSTDKGEFSLVAKAVHERTVGLRRFSYSGLPATCTVSAPPQTVSGGFGFRGVHVGRDRRFQEVVAGELEQVRALAPPSDIGEQVTEMLDLEELEVKSFDAIAAAASTGDDEQFQSVAETASKPGNESNRISKSLGMEECEEPTG